MPSITQQIEQGQLVCPFSHDRLFVRETYLESSLGRTFPLSGEVPILLDAERQKAYLAQPSQQMPNERMEEQYTQPDRRHSFIKFLQRLITAGGDHRSTESRQAFAETIEQQPAGALCISIGGGPLRVHPKLVNLNIGLFPNVDVVGDAYALPYAADVVDAVYCEAVLEHLEFPNEAVREMFRVLRPGGQLFAATPFLQKFHGYPNHFQNFTSVGHERLFARAGFAIKASGVCVGPTFALVDFLALYARYLPPPALGRVAAGTIRLFGTPFRALDIKLNRRADAHILASSTFVHALKT